MELLCKTYLSHDGLQSHDLFSKSVLSQSVRKHMTTGRINQTEDNTCGDGQGEVWTVFKMSDNHTHHTHTRTNTHTNTQHNTDSKLRHHDEDVVRSVKSACVSDSEDSFKGLSCDERSMRHHVCARC